MKEFALLRYLMGQLWSLVRHRKAWLRMNRIDYAKGLCSRRTYKFGNFMIYWASVMFYDFWVMVILFILGPIYFF